MKNQQTFVKDPYVKTHFATEQELDDFIACCDPQTGYAYVISFIFNILLKVACYISHGIIK
jgi:hypothetical protein